MPRLATIASHPWVTGLLLFIYSVAVTLPHEWVQSWLFVNAVRPLGSRTFYLVMAGLALAALASLGLVIARRLPRHAAPVALRHCSLLTLALILLAWRFLTVNNSELVHFAQYAVTGFVLMALTLSVTETLSFVLLLGGIDEAYQYAVLHSGWGIPYDFNDVTLDFLGGAIGVLLCLLYLDARPRPRSSFFSLRLGPGAVLLGLIVAGSGLLLLTGHAVIYQDNSRTDYWFALSRLQFKDFWFFDATWGPRIIHPLAPLEGPILLLGLLLIYAQLDRRYQFHHLS